MSRRLALAILALCLAGCRAPQRTFNPFGYGNPCVPPPATGSVGYGQGYYQAPVGSLYGPTARAMQPVPSLGSAPSQFRTSQAPSAPDASTGATYQPPQSSPVTVAAHQAPSTAMRDNQLVWIAPYADGSTRVGPAQYASPQYAVPPQAYANQQYSSPAATSPPSASLPPTLRSQPSYGLVPPIGQVPGPPQYASPVTPSFARSSQGCCGPNSDLAYSMPLDSAPNGSTVTYETPYGQPLPPASLGSPIVSGEYSSDYRVADDGWGRRSGSRR